MLSGRGRHETRDSEKEIWVEFGDGREICSPVSSHSTPPEMTSLQKTCSGRSTCDRRAIDGHEEGSEGGTSVKKAKDPESASKLMSGLAIVMLSQGLGLNQPCL